MRWMALRKDEWGLGRLGDLSREEALVPRVDADSAKR